MYSQGGTQDQKYNTTYSKKFTSQKYNVRKWNSIIITYTQQIPQRNQITIPTKSQTTSEWIYQAMYESDIQLEDHNHMYSSCLSSSLLLTLINITTVVVITKVGMV